MSIYPFDVAKAFAYYPTASEVDLWAEQLLQESNRTAISGTVTKDNPIVHAFGNGPNSLTNQFVRSGDTGNPP